MKRFKRLFKKKKVYPDELQGCLDLIDELKGYLEMSLETSDYDTAISDTIKALSDHTIWWRASAKTKLIRYRTEEYTSHGKVKL